MINQKTIEIENLYGDYVGGIVFDFESKEVKAYLKAGYKIKNKEKVIKDEEALSYKEFAKLLDERIIKESEEVLSYEEKGLAFKNNLVVVYARGRGLLYFKGKLDSEVFYETENVNILISENNNLMVSKCDDCYDCEVFYKEYLKSKNEVHAHLIESSEGNCASIYTLDYPSSDFRLYDENKKLICVGIVFEMN